MYVLPIQEPMGMRATAISPYGVVDLPKSRYDNQHLSTLNTYLYIQRHCQFIAILFDR